MAVTEPTEEPVINVRRGALLSHAGSDANPLFVFSCDPRDVNIPKSAGFSLHSNGSGIWWTEDPSAALRVLEFAEERTRKLLRPEEYNPVSVWDRFGCWFSGHSNDQEEINQDGRMVGITLTCTRCGHVEEREL